MTHPLKLRHDIVRQTVCWIIGHRWVSSWHRVSIRARRGKHANPYYDHVATWHVKCRRCRLRCADDRWDPWFKSAWWSWRNFWSAFGTMFGCHWKNADWRERAVLPFAAVAFGVEQGWAQWSMDRGWPFWPVEAAGLLTHRFFEWMEARRPPSPPPPAKRKRSRWIVEQQPATTTGNSTSSITSTVRFVA